MQSLRVYNGRILILFFLFGYALSHNRLQMDAIPTCLALLSTYGLISISNFLYDQAIDRINAKSNPYSILTIRQINALYFSCMVITILLTSLAPTPLATAIAVVILLLIGHLYSHPRFRLSHNPISKILSMSAIYTLVPAFLGLYPFFTSSNVINTMLFCLLASAWFLYSDIRDIRGDLLHNKRTVANSLGIKKTALLAAVIGTCSTFFILFYNHQFGGKEMMLITLPLAQWTAFYNTKLITSRQSLIALNVLWLIVLLFWIIKLSF